MQILANQSWLTGLLTFCPSRRFNHDRRTGNENLAALCRTYRSRPRKIEPCDDDIRRKADGAARCGIVARIMKEANTFQPVLQGYRSKTARQRAEEFMRLNVGASVGFAAGDHDALAGAQTPQAIERRCIYEGLNSDFLAQSLYLRHPLSVSVELGELACDEEMDISLRLGRRELNQGAQDGNVLNQAEMEGQNSVHREFSRSLMQVSCMSGRDSSLIKFSFNRNVQ